jgi:hypothetical protein
MQNGIDVTVEMASQQAIDELLLVEVIGDVAIDQVAELVGPCQVVDGDDAAHTALVQRLERDWRQ